MHDSYYVVIEWKENSFPHRGEKTQRVKIILIDGNDKIRMEEKLNQINSIVNKKQSHISDIYH